MRIVGGSANFNGIIFESETKVVSARRINGDIIISTREKENIEKQASKVKSIPFIRGIWVWIEVLLSAPKGFLLTILGMGLVLVMIGSTLTGTTVNIINIKLYSIVLLISVVGVIRFSNISGYHGAEHKIANAYFKDKELTIENVKMESRVSRNCGSNLAVFFILIVSIFIALDIFSAYVPILSWSVAYELYLVGDKRILKPFILIAELFQKHLLTAEPNDGQIEVGIAVMKELLKEGER